jgi:hypothetical protein
MVIQINKSPARRRRETAALMTELMVALGFLCAAVIPLGYSFAKEHKYLRTCYQRSLAMELVDGEMEILLAGEWRAYTNGVHRLAPATPATANLPPGTLQFTLTDKKLTLEWQPGGPDEGGKVIREATRP